MDPSKRSFDEENEAFLTETEGSEHGAIPSKEQHTSRRGRVTWYLRIVVEVLMAVTILFLVFFRPEPRHTIRRTPVPNFPRKIVAFHTDPRYTNENMFFNESLTLHTLHNWIPLSSASRGYTVIPHFEKYDLPTPYEVALNHQADGPGFMMSVFHQLHCLSYLAEHFQQGYGGVELEEKVAHHSAHCFEYLRQGLMCNADTTLEGKTGAGPGEGSEHECVDYDALLAWANEHAAYRWRNGLLPGESIL